MAFDVSLLSTRCQVPTIAEGSVVTSTSSWVLSGVPFSQAQVSSATMKCARGVPAVDRPDRKSPEQHKMRRHREGSMVIC